LRVPRVSTVMDLSRALGWLPSSDYITSPRAKPAALHIWHDPSYIEQLQQAEAAQQVSDEIRARHALGTPANPVFSEMYRRPATAAGGSLLAGELLAEGGTIFNPAGGTHHGLPDRANGFCYLNDPVLAMLSMRRKGVRRIVYLDIDAHHPDGVAVAFRGDPDCLMISVHEDGLWPRTGGISETEDGSAINIPVPQKLNDDEMAYLFEMLILPAMTAFKPDAVVIQCGADALEEDPQSHLSLSNNAHIAIIRASKNIARRFLVLGGGGYNPWSVGRLWTRVWGELAGYDIPDRLPTPSQTVLRNLTFEGNRRGRNPPDHWFTTLIDDTRNGVIRDEIRSIVARLKRQASIPT
jgi:acetoin utilization protein AcuC